MFVVELVCLCCYYVLLALICCLGLPCGFGRWFVVCCLCCVVCSFGLRLRFVAFCLGLFCDGLFSCCLLVFSVT